MQDYDVRARDDRDAGVYPVTVPLKLDGTGYTIEAIAGDQRDVMLEVVKKVKEWIALADPKSSGDGDCRRTFDAMRMTVMGAAGTGKSVLINTIVTTIRTLFDTNDAILVAAPTGAAAYNVGGMTIHRLLGINIWDPDKEPSKAMSQRIAPMLRSTVVLIIDERSMISQAVLGAAEINVSLMAHGGNRCAEDWGGIPIVILVGDDFQLPPTKGDGAFNAMETTSTSVINGRLGAKANGCQQFLRFSTHTMKLSTVKRQHESQREFRDILTNAATDRLTEGQAKRLTSLHLQNFSSDQQDAIITDGTMYLFANKQPMEEFNLQKLVAQASEDNPIAVIKSIVSPNSRKTKTVAKHFDNESTPTATALCRGARVQLCCRNFNPTWGLYNGALGTVREIVYQPGKNPNNGDIPDYVTVEFDYYDNNKGPTWCERRPKVTGVTRDEVVVV